MIQDKSSRIPFSVFKRGLEFSSQSKMDMPQVECLLACAIDFGHMKGYLSHEKLMSVLAKDNAFKKLL